MIVRAFLISLALGCAPLAASAQPLFGNPFAEASAYRSERGGLPEATYRVRYEVTYVERGGAPSVSELVIEAAPDWAIARQGDRTTLYDFRLNRLFMLGEDSFTTANGMGLLVFRIVERQNRRFLQHVLGALGPQNELPDACDAESELGLVIPRLEGAGVTRIRERRGTFTLRCGGRDIGSFTAGDGAAPPAAFWPLVYSAMMTHPALFLRARETGRAPAQMEISYREGTGGLSRRSWRLLAAENVSVPYPLTEELRNATAAAMDDLVPGAGQIGVEVVAGRALGGVPTLQSWDQHLRTLARDQGEAAAAMLLGVTYNMFPELQCEDAGRHAACELVGQVRTMSDPAPWAVLEIGMAEQNNDAATAIAAMQRAQDSPHRDHPALGAAFALAILRFNQEQANQARAANLPIDVAALQNRALLAFPYNVAYWTDVGDRFGSSYNWPDAFMFYDVAYSIPMPNTVANHQVLVNKRSVFERIRRDYPEAFLPEP